MKRLILFFVLMITVTLARGQKSIDELFERYAGKEGFSTVTVNGNLLKLVGCFSDDNEDDKIPGNITEIRILSQEDEHLKVENFYDMVIKDIDLDKYDEFMRVKESNQELRMLVRSEGNNFKEFLLIAGGKDNAIIQIKGNLTFADAKKISKDVKKNNGLDLLSNPR
jgi:hypothetical protein